MTIRRKVFLVILVGVFVIQAGLYWQFMCMLNQANNTSTNFYIIEKKIKNLQHLPSPSNGVTSSFHENGYEDAWIRFVKEKDGLVQVETVESKIIILFRPQKEALNKFNVNWMAPVTVKCIDSSVDCDLDSKHTLYIRNDQVELVQWRFLRKTKRLKTK